MSTLRRRVLGGRGGNAIDLSMVDNAGNPRSSMTTANCYLVHSAGDYCLPLVYGNAIKDGAVDKKAFAPGADTSVANGLDKFQNHNGTSIIAAWITKPKPPYSAVTTGLEYGMNITVDGAELLWQDSKNLISSVSVQGHYLYFTVGNFTGGNAVIAAKSGSTIVWSWHIWATDETLTNKKSFTKNSYTYNLAPVLLGWVPEGSNVGHCPLYQWGRKDPLKQYSTRAVSYVTMYNINNTTTQPTVSESSSNEYNIGYNIQNPTVICYNTGAVYGALYYAPYNNKYTNLWDGNRTGGASYGENYISYGATQKTIYDPCPPGFSVPRNGCTEVFSEFTVNSKQSYLTISFSNNVIFTLPRTGQLANSGIHGSTDTYFSADPYFAQTYGQAVFAAEAEIYESNYYISGFSYGSLYKMYGTAIIMCEI